MEEIKIKDLIAKMKNKELTDEDIKDLWYDWFCSNRTLVRKGKDLLTKLKRIVGSKRFDAEKTFVFFKNNCPCGGDLYDDFRICDIESGEVIYTVVPKDGVYERKGMSFVWGRENNFEGPLVEGTWEEIVDWFND